MTSPSDHDPERLPETQATADEARTADARIRTAVFVSLGLLAGVALLGGLAFWLTRPSVEPPQPVKPQAGPAGARPIPEGAIVDVPFSETAAPMGILMERVNGATGEKLLPETMGGGVAVADFDGDGTQDVLIVNGTHWPWSPSAAALQPTSRLFVNLQKGQFTEATNRSGLDVPLQGMGVACGDYDGDGKVDVFLSAVGQDRLFRNVTEQRGIPRFEDVTETAIPKEDLWGTSAGFFDFDRDGDLDLFVCNYVQWSPDIDRQVNFTLTGLGRSYGPPTGFAGIDSFLWRNNGDGTFTDVSKEAGIHVANPATGQPVGKALGVVFVDANRDGFLEIAVANDGVVNFFFEHNGKPGPEARYTEIGAASGFAFDRAGMATGAMGIDASWFREDQRLGIAIGNFANEMSSLYVLRPPADGDARAIRFSDDAIPEGIGPATRRALTFGVLFFDADLDGWEDYYQANGHIEEEINRVYVSQEHRQPGQLFRNIVGIDPKGPAFVELPGRRAGDLTNPIVGRGAAYGDFDADGDLDLIVVQPSGPVLYYRNDVALGNQWIRFKLEGKGGNRDAIGAEIDLVADGRLQRKHVMPVRSYLSSVELPVTFGLGRGTTAPDGTRTPPVVEAIRIRWPDGTEQLLDGAAFPINREHTIRQP
jgi:hypothetical protein